MFTLMSDTGSRYFHTLIAAIMLHATPVISDRATLKRFLIYDGQVRLCHVDIVFPPFADRQSIRLYAYWRFIIDFAFRLCLLRRAFLRLPDYCRHFHAFIAAFISRVA